MLTTDDQERLKTAKGLRAFVNMKCKDCIYDPMAGQGTWRQQTEGCTVTACPLWPVRPTSRGSNE